MTEWLELYDKASKPRLAQIRGFMNQSAFEAFEQFNKILLDKYNLGYVVPKYTKKNGWIYTYGRSGYILVNSVTFHRGYFTVEDINVFDLNDLNKAIMLVDEMFHDGFLIRYATYDEARIARRNHKKLNNSTENDEKKYKQNCKWCQKVSRNSLRQLYKSDSLGAINEDLLDDVGLTIYVRCKTAREVYNLMEVGKIKCLACGEIISCSSLTGVVTSNCGREYTYHSYRKSFREDNMPRGAASLIFDKFVMDWEKANSTKMKMRLVDNLVHEFHVSEISGKKGRPVGVNLIEGTKKQIIELITELAYI